MGKVEKLMKDSFVCVLHPASGKHERYTFCIVWDCGSAYTSAGVSIRNPGRTDWSGCGGCVGHGGRASGKGDVYWRTAIPLISSVHPRSRDP